MENENFRWDVFISYCRVCPDQEWVWGELVPKLENAGLKVWLDTKCNSLGRDLYTGTASDIERSRKFICVISPTYIRKTRKKVGQVADEFRKLLILNEPHGNPRLIPLLIRGRKLPEKIESLVAIDWTNVAIHSEDWKKLLKDLNATAPEAPPPRALRFYFVKFHFCLLKFYFCLLKFYLAGLALLIAVPVGLNQRLPKPTPTPTPCCGTPTPTPRARLSIQSVGGKVAESGMSVPPAATVAGVVEGEVASASKVFAFVRRGGGADDGLWECAGSVPLDGRAWSLGDVKFRQPLSGGETTAKLLVLLRSQEACEEFPDSEYVTVVNGGLSEPSALSVVVPQPAAEVDARLGTTRSLNVWGEARNLLEDEEEICVCVTVTRGGQDVISKCSYTKVAGGRWSLTMRVEADVMQGDVYAVEVGVVVRGSSGDFRPDGFSALARKERSV